MIKITSIAEIGTRLSRDGDLRRGEGWEPYECDPLDDLGFYQQACEFLLSRNRELQEKWENLETHRASCCVQMEAERDQAIKALGDMGRQVGRLQAALDKIMRHYGPEKPAHKIAKKALEEK